MNKSYVFIVIFIFLLSGCNSNLSEEERKDLWKKAQTTGEIINRSGTPFNSAVDKDLALGDAQNRLITGGGLLGNKASFSFLGNDENNSSQISSVGLPINPYLWKASLETIDFMPLSSTDPFAGIIITDWYNDENNLELNFQSAKQIGADYVISRFPINSHELKIVCYKCNKSKEIFLYKILLLSL